MIDPNDTSLKRLSDATLHILYETESFITKYMLALVGIEKAYDESVMPSGTDTGLTRNEVLDDWFGMVNRERYPNETDEELKERFLYYFDRFIGGGYLDQYRQSLINMYTTASASSGSIKMFEPMSWLNGHDITYSPYDTKEQCFWEVHPEHHTYSVASGTGAIRRFYIRKDLSTVINEPPTGLATQANHIWEPFRFVDATKIATFDLQIDPALSGTLDGADGVVEAITYDKVWTPFAGLNNESTNETIINGIIYSSNQIHFDIGNFEGMETTYKIPMSFTERITLDTDTFVEFTDYKTYHYSEIGLYLCDSVHYSEIEIVLYQSRHDSFIRILNMSGHYSEIDIYYAPVHYSRVRLVSDWNSTHHSRLYIHYFEE